MKMLVQCGLLLLLSSARISGNIESNGLIQGTGFDRSLSFSHWPSLHNGASMWRIRKRELQQQVGQSEGGDVKSQSLPIQPVEHSLPAAAFNPELPAPPAGSLNSSVSSQSALLDNSTKIEKPQADIAKGSKPTNVTDNVPASPKPTITQATNVTAKNDSVTDENTDKLDLSGPGVVKRGIIVFGGFALLAVAYFIFYRKKSSKNDSSNPHNNIDANQFRYGVLESDDRRDNLELSRIPLTMESDEDDEDDLEIFDLEQKRKSMSYVNLQVNDEEIVNGPGSESNDRDNLLLDIEDVNSDALINWSSNGNKSIL